MLADRPKFYQVLFIQSNFYCFEERASYWSLQFIFVSPSHWLPSTGKFHMTPVSYVQTTESYEVSVVAVSRQTSYDSGILRHDCAIIRGLPMTERTETGGPNYRIGPDYASRA